MNRNIRSIGIGLLVTLCFLPSAFCDTIELKDGSKVTANIIKSTDKYIAVSRANGAFIYSIPRNNIKSIRKSTPEEISNEKTEEAKQSEEVQSKETTEYFMHEGKKIQLDIYNPGIKNAPAVILIHGASGIQGERAARYMSFARDLMKEGIVAINVHHGEAGTYPVDTIQKTIDYVQKISNANKSKIGILGYSQGGYIAFQVAAIDKSVKALAVNSSVLPGEFTKQTVAKLPKMLFVCGRKETAINTFNTLKQWFAELNRPFESRVDEIAHDDVPEDLFYSQWRTMVQFFVDNLK